MDVVGGGMGHSPQLFLVCLATMLALVSVMLREAASDSEQKQDKIFLNGGRLFARSVVTKKSLRCVICPGCTCCCCCCCGVSVAGYTKGVYVRLFSVHDNIG